MSILWDNVLLLSPTKLPVAAWAGSFQTFGPYKATASEVKHTGVRVYGGQGRVRAHPKDQAAHWGDRTWCLMPINVRSDAGSALVESVQVTASSD